LIIKNGQLNQLTIDKRQLTIENKTYVIPERKPVAFLSGISFIDHSIQFGSKAII